MRRLTFALVAPALLLTACSPAPNDTGSGSPSPAAAETTTPTAADPDVPVTVTASTTHDDGAVPTWADQEQAVADGAEFSMSFDSAPEPGTEFELMTTGSPQSSAVHCMIIANGKTVVTERDAGAMPSATCVMPAVD